MPPSRPCPDNTDHALPLGLEASEEAIAAFIRDHQLSNEIRLIEAPYWNDGQRQFLTEQLRSDAEWAIVVDELSEALHADATEQANAS
jgi:hypothetical protein